MFSAGKFHEISTDFDVALEATFLSGDKLEYDSECSFPNLIFHSSEGLVKRVYHPATVSGDLNGSGELRFVFLPWVKTEAQFHRLVFRAKGSAIRSIVFARFPRTVDSKVIDDKVFRFKPGKNGVGYINLDFFSRQGNTFVPLFVTMASSLYVAEAEVAEDEVSLVFRPALVADAPTHMQALFD